MSYITIGAIIILGICFTVGLFRGFVRALFKLLSVAGTCILTVTLTPYLAKQLNSTAFAQGRNISAGVLSGLSAIIIVIACALVFGIISFIVNKRVSQSPVNGVNRFLGALFYSAIGMAVLILIGYVIKIFGDSQFMQPVIAESQKDAFANWLVTNNIFNKIMDAVAKEGSVFRDFLNGFKEISSGDVARMAATAGRI